MWPSMGVGTMPARSNWNGSSLDKSVKKYLCYKNQLMGLEMMLPCHNSGSLAEANMPIFKDKWCKKQAGSAATFVSKRNVFKLQHWETPCPLFPSKFTGWTDSLCSFFLTKSSILGSCSSWHYFVEGHDRDRYERGISEFPISVRKEEDECV